MVTLLGCSDSSSVTVLAPTSGPSWFSIGRKTTNLCTPTVISLSGSEHSLLSLTQSGTVNVLTTPGLSGNTWTTRTNLYLFTNLPSQNRSATSPIFTFLWLWLVCHFFLGRRVGKTFLCHSPHHLLRSSSWRERICCSSISSSSPSGICHQAPLPRAGH